MVHWKWAMVQHHAPRVPSRDPLTGCEVVGRRKAWSHFGAVPAFAEGGIHDSMGGGSGPHVGLVIPVQKDGFGLKTRCTRVPTRISKGGNHRVEKDGVPASFLSP